MMTFVLVVHASEVLLVYDVQENWQGDCNIAEYQSPIDINPQKAKYCPEIGYYKFTLECDEFLEDFEGPDYKITNAKLEAFAFFFNERTNSYEAY